MGDRLTKAYNDLMTRLFGEVPDEPRLQSVDREVYAAAMRDVQDEYGLELGDPDFLEWLLILVGRSPALTTSEGEEEDE